MCQKCANPELQAQASTEAKPRIRLDQINLEASVLTAVGSLVKKAAKEGIKLDIQDAIKATGAAIIDLKASQPDAFEGKSGVVLAAKISNIAMEEIMRTQAPEQQTVLFVGNDRVAIKPFETLDDAVATGQKVAQVLYPETFGEDPDYAKYEASLVRAASMIPVLPDEKKFEGLAALLAIVLMGFETESLDEVKDLMRQSLEAATAAEVRKNTTAFLQSRGFGEVA